MPELPEVETIVRGLNKSILNKEISLVEIHYPNIINGSETKFIKALLNKSFNQISRHGKYIFFKTEAGHEITLHLRMTGQVFIVPINNKTDKHTHLEIFFKNLKSKLIYRDIRKFGRFEYLTNTTKNLYIKQKKLAPDALQISYNQFISNLKSKNKNIKACLLDQSIICGLGNIYVDEALNQSQISPNSKPNIPENKAKELLMKINSILKNSIAAGGTSFSDYIDSTGKKGSYLKQLKAYLQTGKKCQNCKGIITKDKIAGRGSYHCTSCQKIY
jgi:formamidopyrimidine-DNA glycosylase